MSILRSIVSKQFSYVIFSFFLVTSFSAAARNWTFTGTGNWTSSSNWPGGYPGTTIAAGDSVFIALNASCTIPAGITITVSGVVVIQGTLINSGTYVFNRGVLWNQVGATFINNSLVQSLNGFGSLNNDGTLTNNNTGNIAIKITINNNGYINSSGFFKITGVNGGTTGQLFNKGSGTFITSGSFTNMGYIENTGTISNNGSFTDSLILRNLRGGVFNNAGPLLIPYLGSFTVGDGSACTSDAGDTITNKGIISIGYNATFFNAGVLTNMYMVNNVGIFTNHTSGRVISYYSFAINNSGSVVNNGVFQLNAALSGTYPSTLSLSGPFVNNDSIYLSPNTRINSVDSLKNTGVLLLYQNSTYENSRNFNRIGVIFNTGNVLNYGQINNNAGRIVDVPNSAIQNPGQLNNRGYIELNGNDSNTGTFANDSTLVVNGRLVISNNSNFINRHYGSAIINGIVQLLGTITLTDTSTVTINSGGTLENDYALSLKAYGSLRNEGSFNNSATISLDDHSFITNLAAFNHNAGILTINATNAGFTNFGRITSRAPVHNKGNFTSQFNSTLSSFADFYNEGGYFVNAGIFNNNSVFHHEAGTCQNGGGNFYNNYLVIIKGTFTISNGIFTNYWNLDINPGATLDIQANGQLVNAISGGASRMIVRPGNPTSQVFRPSTQLTNNGTLTNEGTFVNKGFLVNNSSASFTNNANATFYNQVYFGNNGTATSVAGGFFVNFFGAILQGNITGNYTNYQLLTQPVNASVNAGSNAQFSTTNSGSPTTYQWQVSTDNGNTWNTITDGGSYSGSQTATLQITNVPANFNNFRYKAMVSGTQPGNSTFTQVALLTVH